jgi:hypothetical protein
VFVKFRGTVLIVVLLVLLLAAVVFFTIMRALRCAVDFVGVEHVASGSDFDGSVQVPSDASGLPLLAKTLLQDGSAIRRSRKSWGGNVFRLLQAAPPDARLRAVILLAWLSLPGIACGDAGGATAVYSGSISAEHNAGFFARVNGRPLRRLLIDSGGGDVAAAIELADWIHAQQLDITVTGVCLSSCANYVFPAARHKEIRPGAIVAWHGNYHHLAQTGLWRDDVELRMQRDGEDEQTATRYVQTQVARLVALERDFFARIGVDQRVCQVGKLPPYNVADYYFLSVADMKRFGITAVQAPVDYTATDLRGFTANIVYLELQ